ncbi:MAG: HAMP domain-containing histidine kinase [Proteobacteria bacterium]|nr:HAMP domain-containing histidine kinase [Pseudomonadota bacterium]
MQRTLSETSSTTESSRIIVSQVLNMERTAGQYWVLREATLLQRYRDQHQQLLKSIQSFRENPLNSIILDRLTRLSAAEKQLYDILQNAARKPDGTSDPKDLPDLSALVSDLPLDVSRSVNEKSRMMSEHIDQVERLLLFQALALIPLALLIATVFSVIITRPLHQLGEIINKLGSADFTGPVSVEGPQDIRQLGRRLNWLRQQLAELDQQKQIFLQHVSHELKTPLTSIREGIALLQDKVAGPLTPDQTEIVEILHKNELQLQKEVEALLDFNVALSQEKLGHAESILFDQLIQQAINKHQLELMSRSVNIHAKLTEIRLKGDKTQLTTVIDNLLSNAIKHSPKNARIDISLIEHRHRAQLDVIDNGPGINRQDETRIFEPFYQGARKYQESVSGTGLGLAIANRYVLLHHGSISVINSTGGAHFRVRLPLTA